MTGPQQAPGTHDSAATPEHLGPADFPVVDRNKAKLGQLLFYDPILSGNQNISCATCHAVAFGTSDGVSLALGEGAQGVGPNRTAAKGGTPIIKRIPRNAQALWNLGAQEISSLFHDGRVSKSNRYGNGFDTPAEERLPAGIPSLLAAQALFPLTSRFEMAGDPGENPIAGAINHRVDRAWPLIAQRIRGIPAYGERFVAAFADVTSVSEISIVHIGDALASFIGFEWQSFDSPFDAWLAGETGAMTDAQKRGYALFTGSAGCSSCHGGKLFTDHGFHALAIPPLGPGRTRRFDPYARDVGRMGVTDRLTDAYRFRTPSLRNVALTAPYGHNGAFATLRAVIKHHADPVESLANWDRTQTILPPAPGLAETDFLIWSDGREMERLSSHIDISPVFLSDSNIDDLVAFLHALTGTQSVEGRLGIPLSVPSGLPVDRGSR